jgi:hypothetical protein
MMAEGRNEAQEQNDAGEGRFEGQDILELRTHFEGEFRALRRHVDRRVSPHKFIHDDANRSATEWRVYCIRYLSSSKVGTDHSIHMREDHHMIITVNNLETMKATIVTMMMMISIIHLVLVFVDLLRLMLGRFLYRIIWTLLVRDATLLDLPMLDRRRLEVSHALLDMQMFLQRWILPSLSTLELSSELYKGRATFTLAIHLPRRRRLQKRLLRAQIPTMFLPLVS